MRRRWYLVLPVLGFPLAITITGCGGTVPVDGGGAPDPQTCAGNWQVVFSPEQRPLSVRPEVLRWNDGRLFVGERYLPLESIVSFPDSGGSPSTLFEGTSWSFWIEGDTVLHASTAPPVMVGSLSVAPTWLYATPVGGGPSTPVLKTHIWDTLTDKLIEAWALDAEALYWTRLDFSLGWTLWRSMRDGSGDQNLGALPPGNEIGGGTFDRLVVLPDRLIAYRDFMTDDRIFSLPREGGNATQLPFWAGGDLLGVGNDGTMLWQRYSGGASFQKGTDHYEVGRASTADSSVNPFWTSKPPSAFPLAAWDDGRGGFYVAMWEWGTDEAIHVTMWTLDADGHGQRLACDPLVTSSIAAAAVAPDGIYVVVAYSNQYWEVAKIAR